LHRKADFEDRAAFARTYAASEAYPAAMTLNDSLGERQTKPSPFLFLRRKKRFKDANKGSAVSENTTVTMVPGINSLVDVSDEAADQSSGRAVPEFAPSGA
jgi:hypothetical protein